ncbi:hypothetical protein M9H77_13334 [Catharanthus roseus]|uniref:Uncharacterized protein n=1 Tax=Catharanthus roseus TaxID=4058 RepID=A0ACC0BJX5_CATRO|nr:hypothetical protein M9H77_13334 [Catharanthus roseus]
MVRPSGRRRDADLGPVTDRTGQVEGLPVTASSRGVRERHSTSDLPVTHTPLAPGFHHGTGEAGSSTQPPAVPFRSQPPLQPHLSHTLVSMSHMDLHIYPEPYGSAHLPSHPTNTAYDPYLHAPTVVRPRIPYRFVIQEPILYDGVQARQIGVEFFYQMLGAARQDSSCNTHGYSHAEYGVSSSDPYVPGPADRVFEGLTGSFMSMMSKFVESRNKRPEVARDVLVPTHKRKKVKPFDWEQTKAAEGGPADPELIPSYGGYVAGRIWHGQQDLGLGLTGGLGFNALELHAITTSRQTSQSHQVSRTDAKELSGCWSLLELMRFGGYRTGLRMFVIVGFQHGMGSLHILTA